MAIVINGQTGIDAGHLPISNAGNTEVEGTLTGADVTVASITANSVITQGQNVSPFSGFKNYIINGNFDIWQYGTSQTSYGYGSDDRWSSTNVGSTKTHSRVACTDTERALFNATYFSRTVVTSVVGTNNYVVKRQPIEDITKLAGKTVTVSFWAKADSVKKIWIEHIQVFGTGGTPSTTIAGIAVQEISLTSTWSKYSYTITLPSLAGKVLGTDGVHTSVVTLQFWFDVGSAHLSRIPTGVQQSGTFDIAQVQLEEGSVATPFENRPYGLELSLCQYFLRPIYVAVQNQVTTTAGQNTTQNLYFPSMRTTPTVINKSTTYAGAINYSSVASVTNNSIQYEFHYGSLNTLGSCQRTDLLSAEL